MAGATFAVFVVFATLAATRRSSGAALGVIIFSMLAWPEYLRVPIGLAEMSVPRLLALVVLLQLIAHGRHRDISFGAVDNLVVLIWLWTILATTAAGAEFSHISQMIGRGFDTVLIFFTARLAIASADDAAALFPWLAATALVMCAIGSYEAVAADSPYHWLRRYRGWSGIVKSTEYRYGLFRAAGSTSVSIYFGMAMMLVLGLLMALRGYQSGRIRYAATLLAALLAALSSMSSGPWVACFMLIGLYLFERREWLIKPALLFAAFLTLLLELASNRHFYHLIDYIAISSRNAWYRTRLLEVAVNNMHEFWLFGAGSSWPHHWAHLIDGRAHIDVVNHFLIVALYGGVLAFSMYVASHLLIIGNIVKAWRDDQNPERRRLLFGLAVAIVALDASSMSVGLFGPPLLLSHVLLGVAASVATAWPAREPTHDDSADILEPLPNSWAATKPIADKRHE